jgi:hypothetical protein
MLDSLLLPWLKQTSPLDLAAWMKHRKQIYPLHDAIDWQKLITLTRDRDKMTRKDELNAAKM